MEGEAKVPEAILSNGNAIPLFGLGTWQAPAEELHSAVLSALKRGVRHIDCASKYLNEEAVGSAITSALSQLGLARSELFITSKLWQTDMHRPSDALDESLHRLQLGYLDLWLVRSLSPHPLFLSLTR
jgi:diketogulonate reductase-like aldo/keto reductase